MGGGWSVKLKLMLISSQVEVVVKVEVEHYNTFINFPRFGLWVYICNHVKFVKVKKQLEKCIFSYNFTSSDIKYVLLTHPAILPSSAPAPA